MHKVKFDFCNPTSNTVKPPTIQGSVKSQAMYIWVYFRMVYALKGEMIIVLI